MNRQQKISSCVLIAAMIIVSALTLAAWKSHNDLWDLRNTGIIYLAGILVLIGFFFFWFKDASDKSLKQSAFKRQFRKLLLGPFLLTLIGLFWVWKQHCEISKIRLSVSKNIEASNSYKVILADGNEYDLKTDIASHGLRMLGVHGTNWWNEYLRPQEQLFDVQDTLTGEKHSLDAYSYLANKNIIVNADETFEKQRADSKNILNGMKP